MISQRTMTDIETPTARTIRLITEEVTAPLRAEIEQLRTKYECPLGGTCGTCSAGTCMDCQIARLQADYDASINDNRGLEIENARLRRVNSPLLPHSCDD